MAADKTCNVLFLCTGNSARSILAAWGVRGPVAVEAGGGAGAAFREAFETLENRIELFTSPRVDALGRMSLKRKIDEIGRAASHPVNA